MICDIAAARQYLLFKHQLRERVLYLLLYRAPQRPCAVNIVKARVGYRAYRPVRKRKGDVHFGKALVKRFKARVNLQFARLDLAFKNIASLSLIVSANPNREGLVREDYKKLERAYKELQKLSGQIDVVRASIKSEAVAAAFENYSQALLSITANPMGEIDEAKLNAMLKAASELEPVVD